MAGPRLASANPAGPSEASHYPLGVDAHELAEARSIAMHAAIAEKIARDPAIVERARSRLAQWARDGAIHPVYAARWRELLEQPLDALALRLVADDDAMRALRQSTPFVGVLDPRERWAIRRAVGSR